MSDGTRWNDQLEAGAGTGTLVCGAPDEDLSAGTVAAGTDVITGANATNRITLTGRTRREHCSGAPGITRGSAVWSARKPPAVDNGFAGRLSGEVMDYRLRIRNKNGYDCGGGHGCANRAVCAGAIGTFRLVYHGGHLMARDRVGSDGTDWLVDVEARVVGDGIIGLSALAAGSGTAGDRRLAGRP